MKRLMFPVILFFLLVSEGIALDLLPATLTSSDYLIVPHWVLVFLILINLFYDSDETYFSIVYGVFFGLLIDVVYTSILGAYMFVYPFTLYIVHLLKRFLQTNFVMTIIILSISILITELFIYMIYSLVDLIEITIVSFLLHRFVPTLLANMIFLIPIYLFTVKFLKKWHIEHIAK